MAEVLKKFEFPDNLAKYPWDEWLDGKIRRFTRGTDYMCSTNSFRQAAYKKALHDGLKIHATVSSDSDSVVIQAILNGQPKSGA